MSGERGTAVSKKNASARKKHEKTSIRDRIFQFPRKMTGRLFLLLILCAVLSIFTFHYTMQHQTWVYVELVKQGITSFNPEKIVFAGREDMEQLLPKLIQECRRMLPAVALPDMDIAEPQKDYYLKGLGGLGVALLNQDIHII